LNESVGLVGESRERLANQWEVQVWSGCVSSYLTTQHHIPQDLNPQGYKVIHIK